MTKADEILVRVRASGINDTPVEYTFRDGFILGRHESCQVQVENKLVSRRHAEVQFDKGVWTFVDLNSTNGCWQKGSKVDRVVLTGKVQIEFGTGGPVIDFEAPEPVAQLETLAGMPAFTEDLANQATAFVPVYTEQEEPVVDDPPVDVMPGIDLEPIDKPLSEDPISEPAPDNDFSLGVDSSVLRSLEEITPSLDQPKSPEPGALEPPATPPEPKTGDLSDFGLNSGFFRSLDEIADTTSEPASPVQGTPDWSDEPTPVVPEKTEDKPLSPAETGDWSFPDSATSWATVDESEDSDAPVPVAPEPEEAIDPWASITPSTDPWLVDPVVPADPEKAEDYPVSEPGFITEDTPASDPFADFSIPVSKPEAPSVEEASGKNEEQEKYSQGLSTGLFEALGDIRRDTDVEKSGKSTPARAGAPDDLLSSGFFRTLEEATKDPTGDSSTPFTPDPPKSAEPEDWRYAQKEPEPWADDWDSGGSSEGGWSSEIAGSSQDAPSAPEAPSPGPASPVRMSDSGNWGVKDTPDGWGSESQIVPVFDDTPDDGGYDWSNYKKPASDEDQPAAGGNRPAAPPVGSVTGYVRRFETGDPSQPAGSRTQMMMAAFKRIDSKKKKRYNIIIGIVVVLCIAAAVIAFLNYQKSQQQRAQIAEQEESLANLMYSLRDMQLKYATDAEGITEEETEEVVSAQVELAAAMRGREQYKGLNHTDQLIFDMARLFGENEVRMPQAFVDSVNKYIGYYRGSRKFVDAVTRAQTNGYLDAAVEAFLTEGIPPQFFYLGVQESGMNPMAVGPPLSSKYLGPAKGMWQFIAETGKTYGLNPGPLVATQQPDPLDERHDWKKAAFAAARYLGDIYKTKARASGLLVMASYNWGEHRVIERVKRIESTDKEIDQYLPGQSSKQANFWEMIKLGIPEETRKYVFNIFAMCVIGEDPSIVGLNMENPLKAAIERYTGTSLTDEGEVAVTKTFW